MQKIAIDRTAATFTEAEILAAAKRAKGEAFEKAEGELPPDDRPALRQKLETLFQSKNISASIYSRANRKLEINLRPREYQSIDDFTSLLLDIQKVCARKGDIRLKIGHPGISIVVLI